MARNRELQNLPLLQDTPASEREDLFLKKLQRCCLSFDFGSDRHNEMKVETLFEIVQYICFSEGPVITEAMYPEIMRMFSCNVFHTLPPPSNPSRPEFDLEEDEPTWRAENHVLLVYGFFLKFLESFDLKINLLMLYIDQKFVLQLLELFDSEDYREREYLQTILQRICRMLPGLRECIHTQICNVFYSYIYETVRHNGICELLEVLAIIIEGFVVPLRKEHKEFLLKVLISLHKAKSLGVYRSRLVYCITQFLEKDPTLTESVIKGFLKLWPKRQSQKELLFLKQLQEILEQIEPEEFPKVMVPVFKQLAKCIASPQQEVAECALLFWSNEYIMSLVNDNVAVVLPIMMPSLWGRPHWNAHINRLISNAAMVFMQMNSELFDDCLHMYEQDRGASEETKAKEREEAWKKVEKLASQNLELKERSLLNANNTAESATPVDGTKEELNKDVEQSNLGRKQIQIGL